MSAQSREPMWYCHECGAEMRPLMMPDPHCASCQSTFVEKMENPADDPREFHNAERDFDDQFGPFITSFNDLFRERPSPSDRQRGSPGHRSPSPISRREIRFEFGTPNNRRQFIIGGPNVLNRRETGQNSNASTSSGGSGSPPPRLSDFLRANSEASGASQPRDMNIPGQLMAQYLLALIGGVPFGGQRGMPSFFGPGLDEFNPENGRWGDYVFTQEALDQLMTQLMEGVNSTRPVPATEEIMERLPREVLEEGSALLEKDCAVCKEQFSTKAEDPDEQVVVTLPCTHPFHEGCIMPWLKSSGTCPVCRYALVPQPNAHPSQPGSSSGGRRPTDGTSHPSGSGASAGSSSNEAAGSNSPPNNDTSSARHGSSGSNISAAGLISALFGNLSASRGHSSPSSSPPRVRQQNRRSSRGSNGSGNHIPGSWGDSLD